MSDALEKLLQNPRIWRGQVDKEDAAWQGIASGYPRLDRHLPGGGWPRHALTEIHLDHYGTGELQLLIDGRRTALDIKHALDAQYPNRSDLQAVLNYLEILEIAGLIEK